MDWHAFDRHLRNLGFVPPEFRESQRVHEDPDALGYSLGRNQWVKALSPDDLLAACNKIIPEHERADLLQAALLCHSGHQHNAERHREAAGYGGL